MFDANLYELFACVKRNFRAGLKKNTVALKANSSYIYRMDTNRTIFDKFGGVRPMAVALSEPPSTVQSWKNVGRIPAGRQPDVLARAVELGLDVTLKDVVFPLGETA